MTRRALTAVFGVLACAACASSAAVPRPFPGPGAGLPAEPAPEPTPAPSAGSAAAETARSLVGAPYRDGGSDPQGFDCSGLVQYVFGRHALLLPRTVTQQAREGRPVDLDDIQPGDLLFFATLGPDPSHVGVAIGGGKFVHAPSSNGHVRVEQLGAEYWASRFIGARRVF